MVTVADNSFLLFVYPFLFTPSEFEKRVRQVEGASYTFGDNDEQRNEKIWEVLDFPGDEMLAYVADYLNPRDEPRHSTVSSSDQATKFGAKHATARLWRLTDEMRPVYGLAGWADWRLRIPRRSDSDFTLDRLSDPFGLVAKLHENRDPLSQFICEQFEPDTVKLLEQYNPDRPHLEPLLEPLLKDLNGVAAGPWIYDEDRFAQVPFTENDRRKIKRPAGEKATAAANRWLIEKAYPREILDGEFAEIPFRFGELAKGSRKLFAVQFALFKVGVGFLTVRVKPESQDIGDWLTFLSVFRYVRGQRSNVVRAQKRGKDANTGIIHELPFIPEPTRRTWTDKPLDHEGHFTKVLDSLLRTADLSNDDGQWWQEVFIPEQTLPFASLFVDDISPKEIPELIYKVRNFFPPWQGPNPAPEDLRLDHSSLIPYAENQWFIFSLDGGVFLACDAPRDTPRDREFFMKTLPDHLRDQYFILFLLVLHQRFLLMSLSQQMAEVWPKVRDKSEIEAFEPIRNLLLEFAARGMFTQIMQREHHHRCYRKWQEVFQIKELYEEVRYEVREIHYFLRLKRDEESLRLAGEQERRSKEQADADEAREKRVDNRFRFITLVFGLPALTIGFLGINLVGRTSSDGISLTTALVITGGSSLLGAMAAWLIGRIREKTEDRTTRESERH